MAVVDVKAPIVDTVMPAMKPGRRPMRRIRSAAGTVPQAVPTTKAVTGTVANHLSSPRS